MSKPSKPDSGLQAAVNTVRALRAENGCPWDKAQTHESLRRFLLEESYEALEALDAHATKPSTETLRHFKEELGDLLLQILLHAEISRQAGGFDIDELAGELSSKLIRRHPHVFGEHKLSTPEEVVGAWEKTKQAEKPKDSALDGIPPALPALQRSLKVIEKVSKVGFQWPDLKGPLDKVREEVAELEAEIAKLGPTDREATAKLAPDMKRKLEAELGDLLFTVANVAHFLHLNPEDALRSMLARFEGRFRSVEQGAKARGRKLEEMSLAEMDELWDEAKKRERGQAQ
jgi:tetrapyrrole methylase family protein/MazG family protein